jgi:hypothetical protein
MPIRPRYSGFFTHKASSIREATVRGPHRGDGMSPVSNGNNVPGGGISRPLHRRSSPHLRMTFTAGLSTCYRDGPVREASVRSHRCERWRDASCRPPDRTRLPHRVGGSASGRRKVRAQRRRIARPAAILARSCWNDPEVETCPEAETCTGESLSVASSLEISFRCPVGRGYYPAQLRLGRKSGASARWKQL